MYRVLEWHPVSWQHIDEYPYNPDTWSRLANAWWACCSGVYLIFSENEMKYVGSSDNIARRINEHLQDDDVEGEGLLVYFAEVSIDEMKAVEEYLAYAYNMPRGEENRYPRECPIGVNLPPINLPTATNLYPRPIRTVPGSKEDHMWNLKLSYYLKDLGSWQKG